MNRIYGLLTLGLASTLIGCGDAAVMPGTNNAGAGTAGNASGVAGMNGTGGAEGTAGGSDSGGAGMNGAAGGGGEVVCHPETDISPASTSGKAACEAFCAGNTCKGTAAACEAYYNCAREDEGSAECVAGSAVYFDCLRAQDDLCSPYGCCETQATAFGDACN